MPTRELYDLMVDKRGFLWITHDLGVTRFDGINFTNFYNPKQTSLSGTGLLQDSEGRIWFNNFTGQIFYIQNEKMHLLDGYDYKSESSFPRIAIYKDQLVATSKKGLFFCDTKTADDKIPALVVNKAKKMNFFIYINILYYNSNLLVNS